jgi:hypothetical protein
LAAKLSFDTWLQLELEAMKKDEKQQKGRSDSSLCCEYAQALGNGNVSKAELVLESFFDLVGITEDFDAFAAGLVKLLGDPSAAGRAVVAAERVDGLKEEWTAVQLSLAREITAVDRRLYDRAVRLSEAGLLRLFGTASGVERARAAVEHTAQPVYPVHGHRHTRI